MSDVPDVRRDCAPFRDDLATVALAIASGRRREEVLDHVEQCEYCGEELAQFSAVADAVLDLAPATEPPLGFELRLARRLESTRSSPGVPRRRRVVATSLAALVIALVGIGVGVLLPGRTSPTAQPLATSRPLESNLIAKGHVVGNVILSKSPDVWMIMTIDRGWWSGRVTCQAILSSGKVESLGTFRLSGGYGTWGAQLAAPPSEVRGARLVATNGVVLASATIRR